MLQDLIMAIQKGEYACEAIEKGKVWSVPGKASIIIFGAPLVTVPFPLASSMKGLVHLVKPSARVLAV